MGRIGGEWEERGWIEEDARMTKRAREILERGKKRSIRDWRWGLGEGLWKLERREG